MKKNKTYEDLVQALAQNIRRRRKQRGLTQEDMVGLGFNYRFYQKLESGTYSPNLQTLYRVATALEVNIMELFRF